MFVQIVLKLPSAADRQDRRGTSITSFLNGCSASVSSRNFIKWIGCSLDLKEIIAWGMYKNTARSVKEIYGFSVSNEVLR